MDRLKLFIPTIRKANEDLLSLENKEDYVIEQIDGENEPDQSTIPSKPGTIEMSFSVGEIPAALEENTDSDSDSDSDMDTDTDSQSESHSKDKLFLYKEKKVLLD